MTASRECTDVTKPVAPEGPEIASRENGAATDGESGEEQDDVQRQSSSGRAEKLAIGEPNGREA